MRITKTVVLAALLLAFAAAPSADAQVEEWTLYGGVFDLDRELETWEVGVEARFGVFEIPLGSRFALPIEPGAGLMAHGEGGGYAYATFRVPFDRLWPERWPQRLRVTPYTGVGFYEPGDGKDLGGPVEFRSGIDLGWRAGERLWIGLSFYHLSNAVLYDENPGEESLVLTLSWR